MCSASEAGSYLRLVDSCITQLKAQGPSRTCNETATDADPVPVDLSDAGVRWEWRMGEWRVLPCTFWGGGEVRRELQRRKGYVEASGWVSNDTEVPRS